MHVMKTLCFASLHSKKREAHVSQGGTLANDAMPLCRFSTPCRRCRRLLKEL